MKKFLVHRKRNGITAIVLTFFVIILFASCEEDLPIVVPSPPVVLTTDVTSITTTSATLGGNIISPDVLIKERGVCIGLSSNPTIFDQKITATLGGEGSFGINVNDLKPGASYNTRAYCIDAKGIVTYGTNLSFSTVSIKFKINISVGENGTANAVGIVEVVSGQQYKVTFIPEITYVVDSVTVNGKKCPFDVVDNSYTFNHVTKDSTLFVSFKKDPKWLLKQGSWITVMKKYRKPGAIDWLENLYPSDGILVEEYLFYGDFKVEVYWSGKLSGDYRTILKGDSLIYGSSLEDINLGFRSKIITLTEETLVLRIYLKGYDLPSHTRNPKYDAEVQVTFKHP